MQNSKNGICSQKKYADLSQFSSSKNSVHQHMSGYALVHALRRRILIPVVLFQVKVGLMM